MNPTTPNKEVKKFRKGKEKTSTGEEEKLEEY